MTTTGRREYRLVCSRGRRPVTAMRHEGDGHRPGEWAVLRGLDRVHGKDCYLVEFPDGVTAWWPLLLGASYEFEQVSDARTERSTQLDGLHGSAG